jgi:predicted transposase YbfD/YdcC
VEEKSNEILAVRKLLKAFADLAGVVVTIDAMHTQHDTAQVILGRVRAHWEIDNRLHWVRDVTYREDKSLVRTGNAPHVMATLRSLAISLLRLDGQSNIAAANRHHARDPGFPLPAWRDPLGGRFSDGGRDAQEVRSGLPGGRGAAGPGDRQADRAGGPGPGVNEGTLGNWGVPRTRRGRL